LLCARLCHVRPDGQSVLITLSYLNLTHRDSHEHPTALVPGQLYTLTLQFNTVSYCIPPGHRLGLYLSNTYWPHVWPSPTPVTLTLHGAELVLPTLPQGERAIPRWERPEIARPLELKEIQPAARRLTKSYDSVTRTHTRRLEQCDGSTEIVALGMQRSDLDVNTYTIVEDDPLSAMIEIAHDWNLSRGAWRIRLVTKTTLTSDATHFHLSNSLRAYEGATLAFERDRNMPIARNLV